MAAVQFGDIPDPATGRPIEPNVVGAGHLIEVIAMLQEKTKGNLTLEEQRALDNSITELRFRFAQTVEKETPA